MLNGPTQNQQTVATDERSAAATCMLSLVDPARAAAMVRRSARPLVVGAAPEPAAAAQELRTLLGAAGLSGADYFLQQRERAAAAALQAAAVRVPSLWLTLLSHAQPQTVQYCCDRAGTLGLRLLLAHASDESQRWDVLRRVGEQASIAALSPAAAVRASERGAASLATCLQRCVDAMSEPFRIRELGAAMLECAWRRIAPGDASLLAAAARWNVVGLFAAIDVRVRVEDDAAFGVLLRLLHRAASTEESA